MLVKRLGWLLVAVYRGCGVGGARPPPGRDHQRRLGRLGRRRHLPPRLPILQPLSGIRVLGLNDRRATPAERLANGRDFVPTSRWVLFGHHFAAIAGAGPLVGPVLAAQFGYLPGTIWLVFGVVLGGAVQDFIILFGSMRRDGKSLGQMAKEETGPVTGLLAMVAVLAIMVILLAVLALVVVNALKDSPWGVFTILCTIPIAVLMGFWMKVVAPGPDAGGLRLRRGAAADGPGWRAIRGRVAGCRPVLHVFRSDDRLRNDRATDFSPACCRSGCCSARETTCPPS